MVIERSGDSNMEGSFTVVGGTIHLAWEGSSDDDTNDTTGEVENDGATNFIGDGNGEGVKLRSKMIQRLGPHVVGADKCGGRLATPPREVDGSTPAAVVAISILGFEEMGICMCTSIGKNGRHNAQYIKVR